MYCNNEPVVLSFLHINLGHFLFEEQKLDQASDHFETALQLASNVGSLACQGLAIGHLGRISYEREDYSHAINLQERALKLFRQVKHTYYESVSLRNASLAYLLMGDKKKALFYAELSIQLSEQIGNVMNLAEAYDLAGNVLAFTDDSRDKENRYLLKASELFEKAGNEERSAKSLYSLGRVLAQKGKIEQGNKYIALSTKKCQAANLTCNFLFDSMQ